MLVFGLTGCAVNTRYISYTGQPLAPKPKDYFITIYPESRVPAGAQSFRVIGKVELSGHVSDGVSAEALADQARDVARAKGADAIINARTESARYSGVNVFPGGCGRHYCHPDRYVPYSDALLTFRGELIAFVPAEIQNK